MAPTTPRWAVLASSAMGDKIALRTGPQNKGRLFGFYSFIYIAITRLTLQSSLKLRQSRGAFFEKFLIFCLEFVRLLKINLCWVLWLPP